MHPAHMLRLRIFALASLSLASCSQELQTSSDDSAIVGGTATTEYPSVAYISTTIADGAGTFACTATLITPRVLLTAAHCIDLSEGPVEAISAYFGTTVRGQDSDFIQEIPATDWIHKPWNFSGGDIALILLEHDSDVEPIPFNSQPLNGGAIGVLTHVIGWGNTVFESGAGRKRHMQTPITGLSSGVMHYGNDNTNTCQGDSGGPGLVTFSDGVERVTSITSNGPQGCGGTSSATRVALHTSWINSWVSQKDVAQPPTVSFATPDDGAEVTAGFQVHVEATDNTRVEKVELYLNGELEQEFAGNLPPFVIATPALPDGVVQIEARAYDNRGDVTSRTISVTLDSTCDGPQDCSGVLVCNNDGKCESPNYDLGDTCEEGQQCTSGVCATAGETRLCSSECTPSDDSPDCPGGFDCLATGDDNGLCWPQEDSGFCNSGGKSGLLGSLLMLLALVAIRRRSGKGNA